MLRKSKSGCGRKRRVRTLTRPSRRVSRRRMRGGSLWSWLRGAANTVYNKVIKPTHNFLKDNHVYSSAVGFIPHPAGKIASAGLRAAGYGRRRRVRRVRRGRGPLLNMFKDVVKKARAGAKKLGYGKRKVGGRRRTRRVGGRRGMRGAGSLNGRLYLV